MLVRLLPLSPSPFDDERQASGERKSGRSAHRPHVLKSLCRRRLFTLPRRYSTPSLENKACVNQPSPPSRGVDRRGPCTLTPSSCPNELPLLMDTSVVRFGWVVAYLKPRYLALCCSTAVCLYLFFGREKCIFEPENVTQAGKGVRGTEQASRRLFVDDWWDLRTDP